MPLTVNVTLPVFWSESLVLVTLHLPVPSVVQVALPVAPADHAPVTDAFAREVWLASCTRIITVACHNCLDVKVTKVEHRGRGWGDIAIPP